ncbi:nocturnin-like [Amphiura filiformis]|uniref:nocturnin-like n=1 Tax=Amphiura filiformis TaxID=82378 RepID=UPI003B221153
MEVVARGIYQHIILGFARAVVYSYNRLTGISRTTMPGPALTGTTSASLLQQCLTAQDGLPPLLTREFHSVGVVGNGDANADSIKDSNDCIRVMTWNTLADALCLGSDNFIKCPKKALKWETRKYRCLEEILTYNPDVVCLQEVDHFPDFYQPMLEQIGYKGTFKPKRYSPCLDVLHNSGPDGCAIFYKQNKFEVLETISQGLTATAGGRTWKSNQVILCHRFRCLTSNLKGREVVIGTTHLKAKPGYDDVRHSQGVDLLKIIKPKVNDAPVIIGGDFNAEPTEKVYKAFSECDLNFKSAYKLLDGEATKEPAYTTWKIRPAGDVCHTIDYMWYTYSKLAPVSLLSIPTEDAIGPNRLPSYGYPSDHLSLVCDFKFVT